MQTYRLTIGPDGLVRIPNGKPGQVVTVQFDEPPAAADPGPLTLATAKTPEERAAVIADIMALTAELQDVWRDARPFTVDDLYGDDGLPA